MIKKESNFTPAPQGMHNAVCVDVIDLGYQPTPWGEKHKFRFVWESEKLMKEPPQMAGKPFLIFNTYTVSLDEKANLRKDLKDWLGRDLTKEELEEGFDEQSMVGKPCQILIKHNFKEGTTYANVKAILPPEGVKLKPSGGYRRVKDREGYEEPRVKSNAASSHLGGPTDSKEDMAEDNIPF